MLLIATAALYLWNLSASGWANAFYSAAAQAGASNWTAMLFGSSDAANAITVDKTPAALWVIDVSVRLFGLNPWSVLGAAGAGRRWRRWRCCMPPCGGSAATVRRCSRARSSR